MPIPTEQVMQLIADNSAMIEKLTNQLKTEQDARAHAQRLFKEQTVINKRQAEINKKQAQEINDQAVIINRLRELLQKVKFESPTAI